MKLRTGIIILMLVLGAASCIPSLFPLYSEEDIIWDDRIEGTWDGGFEELGIWQIEKMELHSKRSLFDPTWTEPEEDSDPANFRYRMRVRQKTLTDTVEAEFILHLLRLGENTYVNLFPHDYDLHHEFLSWHMIEANTFMRVDISDEEISLMAFDPEYLENLIEENRIRIDHVKLGGILLTASTSDLQKFVLKYGEEDGAMLRPEILNRINE